MSRSRTAATIACALLLTACGSRVRDWPDDVAAPAAEQVSVRTTRVTDASDEPLTTTTTRGSSTKNTATTTGATPTASSAAIPAPRDGIYFYDEVTNVPAFEDEPAETFNDAYRILWHSTRAGGVVTSESRESSVDDDTSVFASTYRTTASALELLKTVDSDEDGSTTCAYTPSQLVLQLPLRVGAKWHSDSSCDTGDDYIERSVTDGQVTATATDTVGGKAVQTFVIKTVEIYTEKDTTDPDPDDVFTSRTELTTHIDPSTLLVVSEDRREIEDGDTITSHRTLRSLEPRTA